MRILVIEDEATVGSYIEKGLKESGHNVDVASDGKEGLFLASTEQYDALVIDWMLPAVDGITILNALRASAITVPALMLSARGDVDDRVKGLRSGADDYLVKPFAFEELLARLEVLTQRRGKTESQSSVLSYQDLEIDVLKRSVRRAGNRIDLNSREYALLEFLVRHKEQVVTRTMLLEKVWDYHFDPQTNIIDVHISRLRSKIDKDYDVNLIRTIRGSGYMLAAPD